jgi:NAD(P)-dependent dehydrogenase (short-subunit alcohol dehydrogenase family)
MVPPPQCNAILTLPVLEEKRKKEIEGAVLLGRMGQPDDVANAIMFLLSNPYITGTPEAGSGLTGLQVK